MYELLIYMLLKLISIMVREKGVTALSLSKTLVSEIDRKRGDVNRSCYVERLLNKAVYGNKHGK